MFALIMKNPELCKGLLERIFPGRKVKELRFVYSADEDGETQDVLRKIQKIDPETEKTIIVAIEAKSIRMDVLFEDDEAWYDIEMQVSDVHNPAKRSRYYQAAKTVDSMKPGDSYDSLKPGYVIFICGFDLFGLDRPVYSFQMMDEKNNLPLGDGQYTIFLNSTCRKDVPKELESFYHYLQTGDVTAGDTWLERMDAAVTEANHREEVRSKVTLYDEMERANTYMKELEEAVAARNAEKARLEEAVAARDAENAKLEEAVAARNAENAKLEEAVAAKNQMAERYSRLNAKLAEDGRVDDILKAAADEIFRMKLMEELGI